MEHNKDFLNLLLDRRSCRAFRPDPVDRPTLAAIVEAGRYAPSAMNIQKNHFYIITDPALLTQLTETVSRKLENFAGRDFRYGAPTLVLVTNRKRNTMALQDASCAMENMMLAAYSMGVGSCWINQPFHLQDDPDLRALLAPLGVTEKDLLCCALALGLPKGELPRSRPERTGNLVTWVDGV